jgi:transcriptional regulator with XRE-family HTH domain
MELLLDHHKNHQMARTKKAASSEDKSAIELTLQRLSYLREKIKHWTQKEASIQTGLHERTIANYENRDPIGKEIRQLVKAYDTTFAYLVGETEDPGPDPFGMKKRVLTDAEREYLDLCQKEFQAAVKMHQSAEQEYQAAKKYRQEFERINSLSTNDILSVEEVQHG